MEKQRSIKVLSVVALIVAVLGLTVAFAALGETLNITGSGTVKGDGESTTWNVHFEENVDIEVAGDSNLVQSELMKNLNVEKTKVTLGQINMKAPGDTAKYTFTITNDGTESAGISEVVLMEKQCSGEDADVTIVCGDDFEYYYTLFDKYGDQIDEPEIENTILAPGDSITVDLSVGYRKAATQLPSDDVSISNLGIILDFIQK